MVIRLFKYVMVGASLVSLAWHYKGTETAQRLQLPVEQTLARWGMDTSLVRWYWRKQERAGDLRPTAPAASVQSSVDGARPQGVAPPVPKVHKCIFQGETTYTDAPCPAGSVQQNELKGRVTVLEAPPGPEKTSQPPQAPADRPRQ